jgi:hypothetical protein
MLLQTHVSWRDTLNRILLFQKQAFPSLLRNLLHTAKLSALARRWFYG